MKTSAPMPRFGSLLRALGAAALAAGILWAGMKLGEVPEVRASPPTAPDRLYGEDEMPAFPNALEFPLGEGMQLNGLPIRVSYFTTEKSAADVRDFYRKAFQGQGLVVRETGNVQGFTVTAGLGGTSTTRSIVILRHEKETTVFPSVLPVEATPMRLFHDEDVDVPFTGDSMGILDVKSAGRGGGRTVVYQEMQKMSVVEPRMTKDMKQRGWRFSSRQESAGGAALEFQKGSGRARVLLKPYDLERPGTGVVFEFHDSGEERERE
jgi:hypothetical protein